MSVDVTSLAPTTSARTTAHLPAPNITQAVAAVRQAASRGRTPYPAGRFQFDPIDGEPFYVTASRADYGITPGQLINPEVTFTASVADIVALSTGALSATRAFDTGRLIVGGNDPRKAIMLDRWLRLACDGA